MPSSAPKHPILWFFYAILVALLLAFWLLPLGTLVLTASKSLTEIQNGELLRFPEDPATLIRNLRAVFEEAPMLRYLLNSLAIAVPTVIGTLITASLAAFALTRFQLRLSAPLFMLFVAGNFVPYQILLIPVRKLSITLGLYNSLLGLVIFHIAFQTGFGILLLHGAMKRLPESLFDAARIDGASSLRVFVQLVLPLIRPALWALAILVFTFIWNDYFWALVMLNGDELRPVTLGLESLRGQWTASWPMISAGALVAATVPALLFYVGLRHPAGCRS